MRERERMMVRSRRGQFDERNDKGIYVYTRNINHQREDDNVTLVSKRKKQRVKREQSEIYSFSHDEGGE